MCMCMCVCLTWPLSSSRLLVSLRRSKETICLTHCAPRAGESGWKCTRPGAAISPRPATSHEELWKAYLQQNIQSVCALLVAYTYSIHYNSFLIRLNSLFCGFYRVYNIMLNIHHYIDWTIQDIEFRTQQRKT